jgi:hypothetical protein
MFLGVLSSISSIQWQAKVMPCPGFRARLALAEKRGDLLILEFLLPQCSEEECQWLTP